MKEGNREARANKTLDIIQATYSVILEQGYCNTSTHKIAQKAGVTKSMLHYYFQNKDMLMLETNKFAVENMIKIVGESTSRFSNDPDRMDKRITQFWETIKKTSIS